MKVISGALVLAAGLILGQASADIHRQEEGNNLPPDVRKVAVIPLGNMDGTTGAREKTAVALRKFLERKGCKIIEGESVRKAYEEIVGETPGSRDKLIPMNDKDILKVGRSLNVDYILAVNLKWHTKSIYVFPTLRTKADCTADAIVVDVARAEVTLDRRNVKADSENKNLGSAVAAAFTYLSAGAVSGGPKTPPQTLAGVKAVYASLEPFLVPATLPRKIDTDTAEPDKHDRP